MTKRIGPGKAPIIQSVTQLHEVCDTLPHVVWTARPDGTVDYVNRSTDQYTGMALTAAPATWIEALHPDDLPRTQAIWQECVRTGVSYSAEFRLRHRDGSYRWQVASAAPIRHDDGTLLKWYGTAIDIHERKLAEQQMSQLAKRLTTTLDSITGVFFILDTAWRFSYVNDEAERLLRRSRNDLLGKIVWDEFPEMVGSMFCSKCRQAAESGEKLMFEEFYAPLKMWVDARVYPSEEGLAINFRDISKRKEAEHQLALAATGFAHIAEGLVIVDAKAHIITVNPAFTRMTGYTLEDVVGRVPRELLHAPTGRHDDAFFRQIADAANNHDFWEGEIWCRKKNGEVFPQLLSLATVRDARGSIINHVAVFNDITKLKEHEAHLELVAHHDSLTQLPNRLLLLDRLQRALAAHKRNREDAALLFIDLDNFKDLNDSLGHDKGDLLLQQVASRLVSCVRGSDTVARLGGDEFVIMLEGLSVDRHEAVGQVRTVSEKIIAAITAPYQIAGHSWPVTMSIGITLFSDNENDEGDLLKRADLAMYQAKAAGRNTVRFFDPQMQAVARARVALQEELRRGLQQNEFMLHYQPQVDNSGDVIGAEALVRWQHPRRGEISPAEFIALAEETGLILPLGLRVLELACSQLAAWATQPETARLSIAVNVSARQFHHPDFDGLVSDVLDRSGADPGKLTLELTESLLVDNMENTAAKMSRLKAKGVSFSLDDFGTGYSSLSCLKRLPLDQLKIDRSFVQDVLVDSNDAAICGTIMALGKSLGLEVVAEGVETAEQRVFLMQQGCHAYQGYLLGCPLPPERFEAFIRTGQRAEE